jgi:predicted site-specific integrase-resolvase
MGNNERIYTAEAAKRIGISRPTLLRSFAQAKIPEVARDVRGWRVFSKRDIAQIREYAHRIEPPGGQRARRN